MEQAEYIVINGKPLPTASCGTELYCLADLNYTYRNIHACGYRPLHLATQVELLNISCTTLFGSAASFTPADAAQWIKDLLYRNTASEGSNMVRLAVAPGGPDGVLNTYLFYLGPMVYQGYALWHKPLRATALTYEIPFPPFKTSANLVCHNYSHQTARRRGFDVAVSVNYAGEAVSLGEHPLFSVRGRDVMVADADTAIPQSIERMMGIELCTKAGLTVHEKGLSADCLSQADEVFAITPQGIVPLYSIDEHLYTPTISKVLERFLPQMAERDFSL